VGEKAAVATKQNNVALGYILAFGAVNHQQVARPNCRQHTPPRYLQPQLSGRAQNFARQFTFNRMLLTETLRGNTHDALPTGAQLPCVGLILVHERAVVTKTCSWRKDGFSYCFLVSEARGLSEDDSFIVIRNPVCLAILTRIAMLVPHNRHCRRKSGKPDLREC
jgi:hypothetical protein